LRNPTVEPMDVYGVALGVHAWAPVRGNRSQEQTYCNARGALDRRREISSGGWCRGFESIYRKPKARTSSITMIGRD